MMRFHRLAYVFGPACIACCPVRSSGAQAPLISESPIAVRSESLTVRLVDADLRSAIQALGRYLDRPVVIGKLPEGRITLETPQPVPRRDALRLLRGVIESQGIELITDSVAGVYRLAERTRVVSPVAAPAARVQSTPGVVELFVIHLKHAKAADAAATVNSLYGRSSIAPTQANRPQTLSQQLQQVQMPPGPLPQDRAQATPMAAARLNGEVTIVPDIRANTLLIRASRADFTLIEAAVAEIDVRPPQVLIEVVIAEVNHNSRFNLGVSLTVPETQLKGKTTIEGSTTGAANSSDFAVSIMHGAGLDARATITAAAARGEATILSRPIILAANNEQAEINVGSQRPFVQLSRVLATDNAARDQVVEYKDVGTRLRVTPTISADDYVMLQVMQEVNAATAEEAFGAPVISTRSVDTRLLVKDGQTIVLGGLRDQQHGTGRGGIPFLSDIPLIGFLFGHATRNADDTEFYLFLTPRIIRGDADIETLGRVQKLV